jgi:tRNA modification GTPase
LDITAAAGRGAVLREGLRVVLVGAPNVGKSSLLNALAEQDIALVTDIAGTTRDRIVQEISIEGVPMHIIDTAGLRATEDPVEKLGIERTWQAIEQAQAVLLLSDASGQISSDLALENQVISRAPAARAVIRVINKTDLLAEQGTPVHTEVNHQVITVSAKTGRGLPELRLALLHLAGWTGDASAGVFSARARHLQALAACQQALDSAATTLGDAQLELLAESLRLAQRSLAEITGEFSSDDLLGEIFGRFCIGK